MKTKKYTIKIEKHIWGSGEQYTVTALDNETNKRIASTDVARRIKDFSSNELGAWTMNWGAYGSLKNEEVEPYFETIYIAREILKALSEGREVSDDGKILN